MQSKTFLALAAGLALTFPAFGALVYPASPAGFSDSVDWSQLGGDGTLLAGSFGATSALGAAVTVAFTQAGGGLVAVICDPSNPVNCSWGPPSPGYSIGNSLIWAENTNFTGTGPITASFPSHFGAGAYIQTTSTGQFTATLDVYNGASLLGTHAFTSDANGDALFLGALSDTQNITKLVFTVNTCGSFACDPQDFSMDTLFFLPASSPTPEPATLPLTAGVLALIGWAARKRIVGSRS